MAVTTLLGLPIPSMSETVGKTIPDLATAMQMIDEKLGVLGVEAGTWTPAIAGSTVAGNNTYQHRSGRYYKIGQGVYISGSMQMSSKDPDMTGNAIISGIPFPIGSQSCVLIGVAENVVLDSSVVETAYKIIAGAAIGLWQCKSNSYDAAINVSQLKSGSLLRVSGWYLV